MQNYITKFVFVILAAFIAAGISYADSVNVTVNCDEKKAEISDHLYGIFFEDINFAADGGLYAELVQNRSFEYHTVPGRNPLREKYHALYAWQKVERNGGECTLTAEREIPLNRNNHNYLTVHIDKAGEAGVMNTGYDGIPLDRGAKYDFSVYARREGGISKLSITLETQDGKVCGKASVKGIEANWKKFETTIQSRITTDNARLVVTSENTGKLHLDMVSLFPQDTFKGRKNGLRKDLAQALADLEPKFLRFPGGCISHGHSLENAYRWPDTVGDLSQRRGNWNLWGYHQTYGLGFFEYFQFCEDIGAEPLPVVPVGVSCGFRPPYECAPMDELDEWIDEAVNLIEFANGDTDTEWGSVRAEMGHPEPFDMEYICLGNEEHDRPELHERFPHFVKAIREKYPDIKIIGTSGLGTGIPLYPLMDKLNVYSSDEHYYMSPEWYFNNDTRFDDFDRSNPLIFVGEYASQGNTHYNALAEAAFLTGVERNADIVDMTCYAPLFAHKNHTQWRAADLIWFDKSQVVKTPNYYVQQLFSKNAGDYYLGNDVEVVRDEKPQTISGSVGLGSWNTQLEAAEARLNGRKLDLSEFEQSSGDFDFSGGRLSQKDGGASPAISFSPKEFSGEKITYSVRARKTAGDEGFLIVFGAENSDTYYWWNIGGWGNSQHAIEKTVNGRKSVLTQRNGSIKPNRWYEMKVELSSGRIRCYLDNKLIHDYSLEKKSIYASTTLDEEKGEVAVKLVNSSDKPADVRIKLNNISRAARMADVKLLEGEPGAENTFENPDRIKPETKRIKAGREFDYKAPAMSVQFIKIKVD
ncbi:alpha-L-arabinofuranosidase C-terminal domain-containing protein [Sedimentisphaera salicampi]|uniref:alpha-L-arabinofuranosidase C-terminal domain-containing protein n=1 Tax=Sedimentisphaera salicampi TaxID=1941349 RepID=UPI000B9A1D65|nr:alpha-L-arabinofuranosidase C-terminal domain-containing protein [Sedimentisphaera salicampi]OXU15229.1 Extracellular exo-alpha-L-arabinofuranosidase precursor [Sedimentisphaera salicampi]